MQCLGFPLPVTPRLDALGVRCAGLREDLPSYEELDYDAGVNRSLPSPTSGPAVASYVALFLFVAVVVLLVLGAVGGSLTGPVVGLRVALGLRGS